MKHTVVLGIGNRLMGDDGIGVRVVEALGRENESENIRFTAGETDVCYCLDELAAGDIYILIDGACTGKAPGFVGVVDLRQVFTQRKAPFTFHDFDLFHAMKRMNLLKDGILITIEVCSLELSTELSPALQERFDTIVRHVKEVIDGFLLDHELS